MAGLADCENFENVSDNESESCASSKISTTRPTKRSFPTNRKSAKVSKEDEVLGSGIGILNKAQERKGGDGLRYMINRSHMGYVL